MAVEAKKIFERSWRIAQRIVQGEPELDFDPDPVKMAGRYLQQKRGRLRQEFRQANPVRGAEIERDVKRSRTPVNFNHASQH